MSSYSGMRELDSHNYNNYKKKNLTCNNKNHISMTKECSGMVNTKNEYKETLTREMKITA